MTIVRETRIPFVIFAFVFASIAESASGLSADSVSFSALNEEKKVPSELKPVRHIPSASLVEKGIFLNNAVSISIDSASAILIANSREGTILKFDTEGNLLLKTGRFGQAPGEFEFPSKVYPTKSMLFVLDSLRSCVQLFDRNGAPVRQIKLSRSYMDFCINSQGHILAARSPKDVSDYLVDALDGSGNLQFSFGSPLRNAQVPPGMANKIRIAVDNDDNVIVIFQTSARLQKYDKTGSLLDDIQLSTKDIVRDLNYNRKQFSTIQSGKRVGYHHIIESIRIVDGTYYVLRNGEGRIEIFEIDGKGDIGKSYYFVVTEDYYAIDFDLIKKSNELTFYILAATPECQIEVYSAK